MSLRKWRENLFSVYIGRLHPDVSEHDIYNLFGKCGAVADMVILDPKAGQSNRYGFVRYKKMEEAVQAIKELNGWPLKSQRILVDLGHLTFTKMQNNEPRPDLPNVTSHKSDELLPIVSHIDSMKNMVRVKEACVKATSEAFSPSGVVKISRITTQLEKKPYADIAHTSRPYKPRPAIDKTDPVLGAYKKICQKTVSISTPSSEASNSNNKTDNALETFSLLLDQLCDSTEKHSAVTSKEFTSTTNTPKISRSEELLEKSKCVPSQSQLSIDAHNAVCNSNDNSTGVLPFRNTADTKPHSSKVSSNSAREALRRSLQLSKLNANVSGVNKQELPVLLDREIDLKDCLADPKKQQADTVTNCTIEKMSSSNFLGEIVLSSAENFTPCDKSWLPKSLQNSRLAKLTDKPYRPVACVALRTPVMTPSNFAGYNSEGSSSPESSSSLSS